MHISDGRELPLRGAVGIWGKLISIMVVLHLISGYLFSSYYLRGADGRENTAFLLGRSHCIVWGCWDGQRQASW